MTRDEAIDKLAATLRETYPGQEPPPGATWTHRSVAEFQFEVAEGRHDAWLYPDGAPIPG